MWIAAVKISDKTLIVQYIDHHLKPSRNAGTVHQFPSVNATAIRAIDTNILIRSGGNSSYFKSFYVAHQKIKLAAHHKQSCQQLQMPCSVRSQKEHEWCSSTCSMSIGPCKIVKTFSNSIKKCPPQVRALRNSQKSVEHKRGYCARIIDPPKLLDRPLLIFKMTIV
jgi:hypothetical protein